MAEAAAAGRWLDELGALRSDVGAVPAKVWTMRTFATREPPPFELAHPISTYAQSRGTQNVTVGLYASEEIDAPADLLVPIDPADAAHLPWEGQIEVRGTTEPGHAIALTYLGHTIYCAGPTTVPQVWARRYRNRRRRWPRSGAWDAYVGSATGE